jgi:hypothetical protein
MDSKQFLQTMSLSDKLKSLYVIYLTKNGVQEGYNKMVTILDSVIESDAILKQADADDLPPAKKTRVPHGSEPSRASSYRREVQSPSEEDDSVVAQPSPNSSDDE